MRNESLLWASSDPTIDPPTHKICNTPSCVLVLCIGDASGSGYRIPGRTLILLNRDLALKKHAGHNDGLCELLVARRTV
jgi:hypothetical protein